MEKRMENSLRDLADVIRIFGKHNVKIIADYGTLLGVIREGKLIEWDKDTDMSVLCEGNIPKVFPKIYKDLKEIGFKIYNKQGEKYRKEIGPQESLRTRSCLIRDGVFIDLFFWFKINKDLWKRKQYLKCDRDFNKGKLIKDYWVETIINRKVDINENEFVRIPCPKYYGEFLTHRYGNWKKPLRY